MTQTWNPSDKNAAISLSDGNLIASTSTNFAYQAIRAALGVSSGKWYWETKITASGSPNNFTGVGTASALLSDFVGGDAHGWGYYPWNGNKSTGGSFTSYGATFGAGDIIGVALDMDAGTLEFFKNGAAQGIAFTGLSGTLFPMINLEKPGDSTTANFGASGFAYPPPTGYTSWYGPLVYNVQLFGATGGGVSDDTAAIAATVAACELAGGGIVWFPVGTYLMSNYVTITSSNVVVKGAGWGSIIKQHGSSYAPWGFFQGTGLTSVDIRDLNFEGNGIVDLNIWPGNRTASGPYAPVATTASFTIPSITPTNGATVDVPVSDGTYLAANTIVVVYSGSSQLQATIQAGHAGVPGPCTIRLGWAAGVQNTAYPIGGTMPTSAAVIAPDFGLGSYGLGGAWTNCTNVYYANCRFYNAQSSLVYVTGSSDNVHFKSCVFDTTLAGRPAPLFCPAVHINAATDVTAEDCNFAHLGFHSIWAASAYSKLINCEFEDGGETRAVVGPESTVTSCIDRDGWMAVESGQFIECFADGLTAVGNQIINAGNARDPYSTGNGNCSGFGIGGGRIKLIGNSMKDCKGGGIAYFIYWNPYVTDTTSASFSLPAVNSAVTVSITAGSVFQNGSTILVKDSGSGHYFYGLITGGAGTTSIAAVSLYTDAPGFLMPSGADAEASWTGHNVQMVGNEIINTGTPSSTSGGLQLSGSYGGGAAFFNAVVSDNSLSGNQPVDLSLPCTYDPATCVFSNNSPAPDSITSALQSPDPAITTAQLLTQVPIGASALPFNGGFKASATGHFSLSSSNTAKLILALGGHSVITVKTDAVGNSWQYPHDTVSYTITYPPSFSHTVTCTVPSAPTAATVASALAAAIMADGTAIINSLTLSQLVTIKTGSHVDFTGNLVGTLDLQATGDAYTCGASLTHTVATNSLHGTISVPASLGSWITNLLSYTSAANSTNVYRMEAALTFQGGQYYPMCVVFLYDGTTPVSASAINNIGFDQFSSQSLRLYTQLASANNGNVLGNTMQYVRL